MPLNKKNIQKISKWAMFRSFIFGLSFILVASINDNPKSSDKRKPACTIQSKSTFSLTNPLLKHTKKLSTPIITQIESNTDNIGDGDTFILTGYLKTKAIVKNVEVKWLLPDGFTIVNGSKKSFITTTEPEQEYQFKLEVKSNTSVNQVIQLLAKSQMGSSHFSNSSQFNTRLQKEIDQSHLELYERSKKYIEANN